MKELYVVIGSISNSFQSNVLSKSEVIKLIGSYGGTVFYKGASQPFKLNVLFQFKLKLSPFVLLAAECGG